MLTIAHDTSGAVSVEPIAVIRLSLKPTLLSPISAKNISISKHGEVLVPPGGGPPPHIHEREDETRGTSQLSSDPTHCRSTTSTHMNYDAYLREKML
jgi:hypothetical protein